MLLSPTFWVVLALAVPLHWLLPERWRHAFLATVSAGFLATVDYKSTAALAFWLVVFYGLSPRLERKGPGRGPLILGLILVVCARIPV